MKSWVSGQLYAISDTLGRLRRQPLSVFLNMLVVGIALALPLAGWTLLASLQPLTGRLASEAEISVFLKLDSDRTEADALGARLRALPGVVQAELISREAALEKMKQQAGLKEVLTALDSNPLPHTWVLRLKPNGASEGPSAANLQENLARQIRALPEVEYVQIDSTWVKRMEALLRFVRLALFILAAALGVAVVAVIFNTIRLQVMTQRQEIEVVKLIGATDSFIRRPFYFMGALLGLAGGAFALGLVTLALLPLNGALLEFSRLYASEFSFESLPATHAGAFLGLTAILGWLGATLSVGRHLTELEP